jgi:site-specific recombinase XerD
VKVGKAPKKFGTEFYTLADADESAETGWLSQELAIGIRRVKGAKRLGRKMGNWLTRNQAQELLNAASKTNLRGLRDGAMVGLLLGCGLRRALPVLGAWSGASRFHRFQSGREAGRNRQRIAKLSKHWGDGMARVFEIATERK